MARRKHLKDPNLCQLPGMGSGPVWADPLGHGYPEVRDLYLQMLRSLAPKADHQDRLGDPPVPLIPNINEFYPRGFDAKFHLLTPEQQKMASDLYVAIGTAIQTAYQRGLDHGRDLLAQLAKGEVRISDFEEPHK